MKLVTPARAENIETFAKHSLDCCGRRKKFEVHIESRKKSKEVTYFSFSNFPLLSLSAVLGLEQIKTCQDRVFNLTQKHFNQWIS